MSGERKKVRRLVRVGEVVGSALAGLGAAERVEQARGVLEWAERVGAQIAAVTRARAVTPDGTLFVDVATSSWMTELSLMQPSLLEAVNRGRRAGRIQRIRWRVAPLGEQPST